MSKKNSLVWWVGYLLTLTLAGGSHVVKKRVCVVGAGAAGLQSIKQLADHIDEFEPIVFEKNSDVGGLWIYSDNIGADQFGLPVHSSIYSNLRSIALGLLTSFLDYKNLTDGNRSTIRSEVILQYLRDFTSDFNLRQYIRFNTLVEKVTLIPRKSDRESQWLVSTRTPKTNKSHEEICDVLIVCNGHYFKPNIPKIPGIESFPGRIFHSRVYRRPEEFKNQTVLLLGANISGPDIAVQLSKFAKIIYLSHRHEKLPGEQPVNVIQVAGVVSANGSELTLQDGSMVTADTFIYCTGYLSDYPFLDNTSGIKLTNDGKGVEPLYKYVVNVEHPSMAFIGADRHRNSFIRFSLQAQYYVAVLRGIFKLPNHTEMLKETKPDSEWDLYNEYAKELYGKPLPGYYEVVAKIWSHFSRMENFYFKEYNLRILGDDRFEIYKPESS